MSGGRCISYSCARELRRVAAGLGGISVKDQVVIPWAGPKRDDTRGLAGDGCRIDGCVGEARRAAVGLRAALRAAAKRG